MRPNSLFFDRGGKQGLARAVSMIITMAFLVLVGYSIIRYKHFAYLLRTELLTTPQLGWLLLCYAVVALLSIGIIRWANCRVKRMPALWAIGIFIIALLPRLFVLPRCARPHLAGRCSGADESLGIHSTGKP
ncbi:MAG: hypothetical protein R2881_09400 [Eubacteriales bacterium]